MLAAYRLTLITVEGNEANERASLTDQLPQVMLHELAKNNRGDFYATVGKNIHQLKVAQFTSQEIEQIEKEHGELGRTYGAEKTLQLSLDACGATTSLKKSWGLLGLQFSFLHAFAADLATDFPNTSTLEADFCWLRREKSLLK